MPTSIYNHSLHLRDGKFGRAQQHFERKMNDYIDDIRLMAEGFMTPVALFTKKKSGLIDSDKLSETADNIVNTFDSFKSDEEKDFYRSFVYCALALLSLDFEYYGKSVPGNILTFPPHPDSRMDFRYLLENLETDSSGDGTYLEEFSIFAMYLPLLYELFSGKTIELRTADTEISLSPRESAEMNEDVYEHLKSIGRDFPEAYEDYYDDSDAEEGMSSDEIREGNTISAARLRSVFPGYEVFVRNMERFSELYDKYITSSFRRNIISMISAFLAEGGYTIFSNEEAYIELMVALTRARKTCLKTIKSDRKD